MVQKSGDHQLRLVVHPIVSRGFRYVRLTLPLKIRLVLQKGSFLEEKFPYFRKIQIGERLYSRLVNKYTCPMEHLGMRKKQLNHLGIH